MRPILLVLAAVVAACSPMSSAYPVATDSAKVTCQGGPLALDSGFHLVLHGRLDGGTATTWVNDATRVLWPSGYQARFEPTVVVYDGNGIVRGREGEDMAATVPWHAQPVCMNRDLDGLSVTLVWPAGAP